MMYLAVIDDSVEDPVRGLRTVRRRKLLAADTLQDLLALLERWVVRAYTRCSVEKVQLGTECDPMSGAVSIEARLVRTDRRGNDLVCWKTIGKVKEWERRRQRRWPRS